MDNVKSAFEYEVEKAKRKYFKYGVLDDQKALRMLYLSKRGKNTPEMSQGELIDDSMGDEI